MQCKNCGTEFEAVNGQQKYCGAKCRYSAEYKRVRERVRERRVPLIRKCKNCGSEFEVKHNARFCSNNCYARYWRRQHPKPRKILLRKCKNCGCEFEAAVNYQKYCSERCRSEYYGLRRPPSERKNCEYCGAEFETRRNARFCSSGCYLRYWWRQHRKTILHKCRNCGAEFEIAANNQQYCSERCRSEFYSWRLRSERPPLSKKSCEYCGAEFEPVNEQQKYCGAKCRKLAQYKRVRERARERRVPQISKCEYCGVEFKPKRNARFCSNICYFRYWRRQRRKTYRGECRNCGREFESSRALKYCSAECRESTNREKIKKSNARRSAFKACEKVCEYCGKKFMARHLLKKYCGGECYEKAHYERVRRYAEEHKAEIKARKQRAIAEKVAERESAKATLTQLLKEARACGLSYGRYKMAMAQGRSFEELKSEYESQRSASLENELWYM